MPNGQEPALSQRTPHDVGLGGQARILHMVELLKHDDEAVRERALFALAEVGDERAVDGLFGLLRTGSLRTQQRALFALGSIETVAADQAIIWALEQSPPRYRAYYVRYGFNPLEEVIVGLGQRAIRPLRTQIQQAEPWRREQARELLEAIRKAESKKARRSVPDGS